MLRWFVLLLLCYTNDTILFFPFFFLQTDLKRLLRNPPLVKIPKINDIISAHPFLGALPSSVCESLECSTKEKMKTRGMTLYKEGSRPNGIWLISNGVVKVPKYLCMQDKACEIFLNI